VVCDLGIAKNRGIIGVQGGPRGTKFFQESDGFFGPSRIEDALSIFAHADEVEKRSRSVRMVKGIEQIRVFVAQRRQGIGINEHFRISSLVFEIRDRLHRSH